MRTLRRGDTWADPESWRTVVKEQGLPQKLWESLISCPLGWARVCSDDLGMLGFHCTKRNPALLYIFTDCHSTRCLLKEVFCLNPALWDNIP